MKWEKTRKRRREQRRRLKALDHNLWLIKTDIEMLDRVLESAGLTSEWSDIWVEAYREGMATAYDLLQSRIEDITIRAAFVDRPIRIRYREGRTRTVKDELMMYRRRSVL